MKNLDRRSVLRGSGIAMLGAGLLAREESEAQSAPKRAATAPASKADDCNCARGSDGSPLDTGTSELEPVIARYEVELRNVNRVYALRVESADAALDLNDDAQVTDADRSAVLEQKGVAPGVRIETPAPGRAVPAGAAPGGPGALPAAPPSSAPATCFAGIERLSHCVSIDTVLRTFWKRTSTN